MSLPLIEHRNAVCFDRRFKAGIAPACAGRLKTHWLAQSESPEDGHQPSNGARIDRNGHHGVAAPFARLAGSPSSRQRARIKSP